LIGTLYAHEEEIRTRRLKGEPKHQYRLEHEKPVVERFFEWADTTLNDTGLLPSNPLTKALAYARERRAALEVFLADPHVPIDTNHLERALRPIPMGRKNWLFCCVPQAHRGWNPDGSIHLCKAVGKMTVGPSKSAVRSRLQTTPSGWHQECRS
jgi:hypothetical protein